MAEGSEDDSASSAPPLYVWLICCVILGILALIGIGLFLVLDEPLQLLASGPLGVARV